MRLPVIILCIPLVLPTAAGAELLVESHGTISFAPYVTGVTGTGELEPGYQAEFMALIDLYRIGDFYLTGQAGNMTIISRSDDSIFNLDRVRYTVAPGFRYRFRRWLVRGSVHHESYFPISRAQESGGNIWMNSIRLGAGTNGSYYPYLRAEYTRPPQSFIDRWDARIDAGAFLHGDDSIWIARHHSYRYELLGLVRCHLATYHNWVFFTGMSLTHWFDKHHNAEHKASATVNAFVRGRENFFGIYYTYVIDDTFSGNNEDRLGSLGLRVVF